MNKNIAIFILIIILGGAGVVYVAFPNAVPFLTSTSEEVQDAADTEDETPSYTITPIQVEEGVAIPDLEHSVQFSDDVPEEFRTAILNNIATLKAILRQDATNAGAWFDLAVYYYNANDYDGAREIWEFLVEVAPNDTVAYENLAKLYHFSTPDFPKSESYFKQSLAIDPDVLSPYLGLFDLYRYSYKTDTSAAADILNQAITKFPEKLDPRLALGVYYRDRGNYTKAREVLEEGLNKARDANDIKLITAFGEEIGRIPE